MPRFSDILIEHFHEPRNLRKMDRPDRTGQSAVSGGGTFTIYLRLNGDQVTEATFEAVGCGVTVACGSMLTELVEGRSIADCKSVTPQQLTEALAGVPPDKRHCPMLAVAALHDALRDAISDDSAD
jgi:nitrogen fixation NifU-like protein